MSEISQDLVNPRGVALFIMVVRPPPAGAAWTPDGLHRLEAVLPRVTIPRGSDGPHPGRTRAAGAPGGAVVKDNAHWISDVILGSAIGHFAAKAIAGGHAGGAAGGFSLVRAPGGDGATPGFCFRF